MNILIAIYDSESDELFNLLSNSGVTMAPETKHSCVSAYPIIELTCSATCKMSIEGQESTFVNPTNN